MNRVRNICIAYQYYGTLKYSNNASRTLKLVLPTEFSWLIGRKIIRQLDGDLLVIRPDYAENDGAVKVVANEKGGRSPVISLGPYSMFFQPGRVAVRLSEDSWGVRRIVLPIPKKVKKVLKEYLSKNDISTKCDGDGDIENKVPEEAVHDLLAGQEAEELLQGPENHYGFTSEGKGQADIYIIRREGDSCV